MTRLIDDRLQQPASPSCRRELLTGKVEALLAIAKTQQGEEGIRTLEVAVTAAGDTTDPGVRQLATAELATAKARMTTAQQQATIARQQEVLSLHQALQELQRQQPRLAVQDTGDQIKLTIPGTLFALGHDTTEPEVVAMLKDIAAFARSQLPGKPLTIVGHADAQGTQARNREVSEARARNVANALIQHGLAASLVTPRGLGDTAPMTPNLSAEEQAQNRRVEILIDK